MIKYLLVLILTVSYGFAGPTYIDGVLMGQNIDLKSGIYLESNPFVSDAEIIFTIHRSSETMLSIVDVSGRTVTILVDGSLAPGNYSYTWHCANQHSGVYFAILKTNDVAETIKLIKARD